MKLIPRSIIFLPPDSPKLIAALANIVLLFLCFWLFRPVYPYLGVIFTREEFRTNQVVLLVIILLIAMQLRRGDFKPRLLAHPQLNPVALILILFASGLFIVSERYLDINTLSASLFGLALYGMVGLWMDVQRWRRGLPVALLFISALPFGEHMQTFIGYPVRIATAAVVREGLALFGVHSIGVDTILVFENGISQVDLPCSGVKSLWTGGIFLLAATWIERRPLNLRWLVIAFIFSALLLTANLARVAILVALGQVADFRLLAEMAHVPLGVIGFVGACAAAIWMLRRACVVESGAPDGAELHAPVNIPAGSALPVRVPWLAPALSGFMLMLVILYTPRPRETSAQIPPEWDFPTSMEVTSWPLTFTEAQILGEAGAESAQRWRFEWHGQTGSILFVSSTTWRAHHRPERCFEVYGLSVNTSYAYMAAEDFPVRALSLGKGRNSSLYSAAYWLQSADSVTEDYAARIWSDLSPQRERWTLVTVLFDTASDPVNQANLELYEHIRQSVADALGGGF